MEMESTELLATIKHFLKHENKASTKQGMIILWAMCNNYAWGELKSMTERVLHYIKLTNQLQFKSNFQKVSQYTGGKWLNQGTKHHQGNQLKSMELPPRWEYKFDTKESDSRMFNPIF